MNSDSPIIGVYILNTTGIPLFARHYHDRISENEAILLGGFFSAIEIFARSSLHSNITDFGLIGKRFYFNVEVKEFILVILVDTTTDYRKDIIELISQRLIILLQFLVQYTEELEIDLEKLVRELDTTVDSFVLEATLEHVTDQIRPNEIITGKSINPTQIAENELLKRVRDMID